VVRGQYVAGSIEGKEVPGYHDEKGVKPSSRTETYVALRTTLNNWRWADVPFYLRTGKRLPQAGLGDRDPVPPAADDLVRGR